MADFQNGLPTEGHDARADNPESVPLAGIGFEICYLRVTSGSGKFGRSISRHRCARNRLEIGNVPFLSPL